jgi:hypothetical protein
MDMTSFNDTFVTSPSRLSLVLSALNGTDDLFLPVEAFLDVNSLEFIPLDGVVFFCERVRVLACMFIAIQFEKKSTA